MPEVNPVKTPVDMRDVERAVAEAWLSMRGEAITPEVSALILALIDLEVATGTATKNFNLGQIIATRPAEQDYYMGLDSGNLRRFRSWPNLAEGARAVVRQLTSDTRPKWREGLLSGNPDKFVESLGGVYGGPKYFEANLERYRNTFLGRWKRYAPGPTTVPPASQSPGVTGSGGGAAGGLLLSFLLLIGLGAVAFLRQ
jgi:hypothetical protein